MFIIGCGRSGTTILGQALGLHPAVMFLNEPRHIWIAAYPKCDVWSPLARWRRGRLSLTAADADRGRDAKLRWLLAQALARTGRPQLIEKLPVNSFRLEFISVMFPDARFLHLIRDGRDVARSIGARAALQQWYGEGGYKWQQLSSYASNVLNLGKLVPRCRSDQDRGLLEWRMSVESAQRFFEERRDISVLEVRYEKLLAAPVEVLEEIERFVGLAPGSEVREFGRRQIQRRSVPSATRPMSQQEATIAGELLGVLGYGDPQVRAVERDG